MSLVPGLFARMKRKNSLIKFGKRTMTRMKTRFSTKRKEVSPTQRDEILNLYLNFEEGEKCQVHPNKYFGYTTVQVEQPLIENGSVVTDLRGNPKPNISKRDHERVSLSDDIDEYFDKEVKPHLPDSWLDRSKDKVGYEINFPQYFYKF